MSVKFRSVETGVDTTLELEGKEIHLAVYDEGAQTETRISVSEMLAKHIDCGAPLDLLLKGIRDAILYSARRYGNRSAPQ